MGNCNDLRAARAFAILPLPLIVLLLPCATRAPISAVLNTVLIAVFAGLSWFLGGRFGAESDFAFHDDLRFRKTLDRFASGYNCQVAAFVFSCIAVLAMCCYVVDRKPDK